MPLSAFPVNAGDDVGYAKHVLALGRSHTREEYIRGKNSATPLHRLSRLVDDILKTHWHQSPPFENAALIAVGGYGRGKLYPYSDIDILILLPKNLEKNIQIGIEQFISFLWDIGLEPGHSVRTVDECVTLAQDDVTVQTNLLESRYLCGDRKLFKKFFTRLHSKLDAQAFYDSKVLEQQQRYSRYYNAIFNLEPNLKTAPGGIRDLQTIFWIAQAANLGNSWKALRDSGVISEKDVAQAQRDERFLSHLRIRLHYLAGRCEDRLLFDYQKALAEQLGLSDKPHRYASEQLMQRYYRTTQSVRFLNEVLLQDIRVKIFPPKQAVTRSLNSRFEILDNHLAVKDERIFIKKPSAILESFLLLEQHPEVTNMSAATLQALRRAKGSIGASFRRDTINKNLFMQILRQPHGVARELRRMNQYDILGRYIPAFGHIVGQMQHDLYHVYTVDEHILTVVRNLRRFSVPEFAHEYPLCSKLMNDYERPEILYLAGLFHDIAKGRGGNHSTLGAVDARRFGKSHGLIRDDIELMAWLVESHLYMSATAQKQDLSDQDVIASFAAKVSTSRRLISLYLLTVADIRGTSPKVWNAWKAKLLEELYCATFAYLSDGTTNPENSVQRRQSAALEQLRLYAISPDAHVALWTQFDTAYFIRHDAREIAWHTRLINNRVQTSTPIVKAKLSIIGEGLQVALYVRNKSGLFARICSFFESIHYSIVEAKIYTTRDGYALNSLQVLDPENKISHYRDVISFIEHGLDVAVSSTEPLAPPAVGRISRQLRHFPITPQVTIRPDEKGAYFVLSIIAGDRLGLLSRIANVLLRHSVNLYTAKINTLGERAEDTFLIYGEPLNNPQTLVRMEAELIEQLRTE